MSTTPNGAPLGAPAPAVDHNVKFRVAGERHICDSQQCPEPGTIIQRHTKYARVMRVGRDGEVLEFFHPKCYDYEFDQGAHSGR